MRGQNYQRKVTLWRVCQYAEDQSHLQRAHTHQTLPCNVLPSNPNQVLQRVGNIKAYILPVYCKYNFKGNR